MLLILEAESLTAAGAVVVESVVTVVVVVESVFVSEDDELPPHEVMKAAIATIARNFFIVFLFKFFLTKRKVKLFDDLCKLFRYYFKTGLFFPEENTDWNSC
jgi:hypothetical protein